MYLTISEIIKHQIYFIQRILESAENDDNELLDEGSRNKYIVSGKDLLTKLDDICKMDNGEDVSNFVLKINFNMLVLP